MNTVCQEYVIKEKLAQLEDALLSKLPTMPTLLRDIHSQLKKDAELVTILSEEECKILVKGLEAQTKTELAATLLKKKGGTRSKPAAKLTVDDL